MRQGHYLFNHSDHACKILVSISAILTFTAILLSLLSDDKIWILNESILVPSNIYLSLLLISPAISLLFITYAIYKVTQDLAKILYAIETKDK